MVSTTKLDFRESLTPEVHDSQTSVSVRMLRVIYLTIRLAKDTKRILCAYPENWTFRNVAIFGADETYHSLWGREWLLGALINPRHEPIKIDPAMEICSSHEA